MVACQRYLALRFGRIDAAAYPHIGRHRIAGRMNGTHGGGGIGDADALHRLRPQIESQYLVHSQITSLKGGAMLSAWTCRSTIAFPPFPIITPSMPSA
ncbi:MAG: hypothetical protein PVI60_13460 [Desulfobacteraceae bacterium]|jgi:hypothetical protein